MMDILEIDAVSFAARTAQVAAAELYGLLAHGVTTGIVNWYDGSGTELGDEKIEDDVAAMAAYTAKRKCAGETLFIWNFQNGRAAGDTGRQIFAEQSFARRLAYDLFASTMVNVAWKILDAQQAREAVLRQAQDEAARAAQKVKLEDTIFEPEEGLGTLRPEAQEAASQVAAYDHAQADERRRKRAEQKDREEQENAAAAAAAAKGRQRARPAPMSAGEAPPAAPVNRGGRGNKKSK
jgi:hypothetical protein